MDNCYEIAGNDAIIMGMDEFGLFISDDLLLCSSVYKIYKTLEIER